MDKKPIKQNEKIAHYLQIFFSNQSIDKNATIFCGIFILGLYLIGAVHWYIFFDRGDAFFTVGDWSQEYNYYHTLKTALKEHKIPYYVSRYSHQNNRFLGIPDICLSPQILLFYSFSLPKFILCNILTLYSLGFLGCLIIKRRYSLSLFAFIIFFFLFNFNGHIVAHLSTGHTMWSGYFLLPFFCLFVLELVENPKYSTSIKLAVVLFLMMLQGAFHFYIWGLLFFLLMVLFSRKYFTYCTLAVAVSAFLSMFRLIPSAIAYWDRNHHFLGGYPTLSFLFKSLTTIPPYSPPGRLQWWEYDIFLGVIGLGIVIYAGIYLRFSKSTALQKYQYRDLDWPLFLFALFSLNYLYAPVAKLPIPLIDSERVTSRFLIVPLVFILIIGSIRISQLWPQLKEKLQLQIIAMIAVIEMATELLYHSMTLKPSVLKRPVDKVDLTSKIIVREDPLFETAVHIAYSVSILSILIIITVWLVYKFRQNQSKRSSASIKSEESPGKSE